MKYFDKVKIMVDKEEYLKEDVHKGEVGIIWLPEIRDNSFYVAFETGNNADMYKYCIIDIEDLELVEEDNCPDKWILEALPKNNPKWWCKVEDGYIVNLLGERKNRVPYDYNS